MDTDQKRPAAPIGRKIVQYQSILFPRSLSEISSQIIRCFPFVFITSLFVAAGGISAKAPLPSDGNQQKHLDVEISQNYPPVCMKDQTSAIFHLQLAKEVAIHEQWSLAYKYIGYCKNIRLRQQEG